MSLLGNITATAFCMATGGWGAHDFDRHGDYLVCQHCGHRVRVKP